MKRYIVSLLLLIINGGAAAQAVEIEASFSPVLWNYKEMMAATAGFAGTTPLNSSVSGMGWLLDIRFHQQFFDRWTVGITGEALSSVRTRTESVRASANLNENTFDVNHTELRADVLFRWDELSPNFSVGGWAAWQDDLQWRQNFYVNGTRFIGAAAEPVRQTIQGTWLGVSVLMDNLANERLRLRLDVGVPLAVKMVNDAVPGETFTNNQVLRYNLAADYRVYASENGMETMITAAYRFRELGNEVRPTAIWAKNQWRTFSLGVRQTW